MLSHYLKIAFRNMWKYKSQTLISLIGLAVGFTCFALSMLWIRYEMTYDSFHTNVDRIYIIYTGQPNTSEFSRRTSNPLAAHLKETFPEIMNAVPLIPSSRLDNISVEGVEFPSMVIFTDSSLFRMFDVKILEGSKDFLIPDSRKLAITPKKARQLFGDIHPIGKTVKRGYNDYTICAIVSEIPKRSNFAFDFIGSFRAQSVDPNQGWNVSYGENTIIELFPETNIETFEKKLYEYEINKNGIFIKNLKIIPVKKLRYSDPNIVREVKFQHILIFALSGLLVIFCSLFNYLTLFVSRFRLRQKELALRVVCGASGGSLLAMLTVEFMLTLLFSVIFGCMLTQWVYHPFLLLSDIQMALSSIYLESFLYIGSVILVSMLLFWLILFIFRRRNLNLSIRRSHKNIFRKASIVTQIVISVGFSFCAIIILKQIYYLHHTSELGFSFQNRGSVSLYYPNGQNVENIIADQLKQIPEITEVIDAKGVESLIPQMGSASQGYTTWDNMPVDAKSVTLELMRVTPEYSVFYDFRLVAGEWLTDADPDSLVLLNESAVKAFGWHNATGKKFGNSRYTYTVKGVIKNIYNYAPTISAKPVAYLKPYENARSNGALFKYRDGQWNLCKEKIEQLIKRDYENWMYGLYNAEEIYDKFLKSENALIKLLSFVSAICILICVFGFVSLVSLTLEERRKSIAIRKINGATSGNILAIFAKEYSLLLLIGSIIALTAGFFIMQRWLEQYVKQTGIPVWIYLSILFVTALIIVLCVGWQVWRASVENPSEVVKMN